MQHQLLIHQCFNSPSGALVYRISPVYSVVVASRGSSFIPCRHGLRLFVCSITGLPKFQPVMQLYSISLFNTDGHCQVLSRVTLSPPTEHRPVIQTWWYWLPSILIDCYILCFMFFLFMILYNVTYAENVISNYFRVKCTVIKRSYVLKFENTLISFDG